MRTLKVLTNSAALAANRLHSRLLGAAARLILLLSFVIFPVAASAQWSGYANRMNDRCGAVDYSWDLDGLQLMVNWVTSIMTAVLGIVYTIGSILSIVSATNIYVKMNTGEEGFTKNVMMLIGSIIFMIAATMVLPAFFGWNYSGSPADIMGGSWAHPK